MRSQIPWTKGQFLKIWSIFSIFWLHRQHMFEIFILVAIRYSQIGKAFMITNQRKFFIFSIRFRWCLFFGWIEKTKIFDFFNLTKSNQLISINKTKLNLLSNLAFSIQPKNKHHLNFQIQCRILDLRYTKGFLTA